MGNDNIIEFNGKRYDAITGKLLGKSRTEVAEPLAIPVAPPRRHIDGVVRRHASKQASEPHHAPHSKPSRPLAAKPHRQPGRTDNARQPQPAKTLMRRAVRKPKTSLKPAIKPQAPAEVAARPVSSVALKHSVQHIDPQREHRARQTPKSHAVRRFSPHAERLAIAAAVHPMPPRPSQKPTRHHHENTKPDIFEAAIAHARSHEQPAHQPHPKHRRRRKTAGMLVGAVTFLLLGGVLAYANLGNIRITVASVQAGFSAQMPAYKPTGYVLGAVTTSSGNVSINFRSGEKHYRLIQQPTNWNSQTLHDSIIASAGAKTIENHGRIIYIYDDVASWVSGGIRYDLTGNAELDPQEVAAIAASL
ncbi:MAG: hypothetical protein ACREGD_00890 [Candidatus Saccharimonadales bacterium]